MSSAQLVYDVEKLHIPADSEVPTGAPIEAETPAHQVPPSPLNGLTIGSIILTVCGVGLGLAAGAYTTASYDGTNQHQSNDKLLAQFCGFLGIASFATSIPLLACGARQYQNARGSKGLNICMILGWIAYGLGMLDALILLGTSLVTVGYVQAAWVYLAILYNVIPFFLFLAHAEYSRRR